jgi:hypothetical protein
MLGASRFCFDAEQLTDHMQEINSMQARFVDEILSAKRD